MNKTDKSRIAHQSQLSSHPFRAAIWSALVALSLGLPAHTALAQNATTTSAPMASLGSGKEPIKIDADRLDVFDSEKRATFTGNVVAVQGDTTIRCSALNVFYEQSAEHS